MNQISENLAEFVGIMLGDGCSQLKNYQITISCGTIDGTYISEYIPLLIKKLFSKKVRFRKMSKEGLDCIFASKEVVSFMAKQMNFKSPKINCKIPFQFFKEENLLKACVRGLFETDGGLHRHHKKSAQLKFTNKTYSIIQSLYGALKQLGFNPCTTIDHKEKNTYAIYLFNKDVKKFSSEIGFNNPKNKIKYQKWIKTGIIPLNNEIEQEVRLTKEVQEKILNKNLDSIKSFGFGSKD